MGQPLGRIGEVFHSPDDHDVPAIKLHQRSAKGRNKNQHITYLKTDIRIQICIFSDITNKNTSVGYNVLVGHGN